MNFGSRLSIGISQITRLGGLTYRQPSAGATWVRMLSMTWAL
jgi:hypothetical protein